MAITDPRLVTLADQTDADGKPFYWVGGYEYNEAGEVVADLIQRASYGKFVFNPATTETLRIAGRPVQDDADRTIKYVEWTLILRTIVIGEDPDTADANMNYARHVLTSQGLALTYQIKGFGDFNINVPNGGVQDPENLVDRKSVV